MMSPRIVPPVDLAATGHVPYTVQAATAEPSTTEPAACPDSVAWCLGDPQDHRHPVPGERLHRGIERRLTTAGGETVSAFSVEQYGDQDRAQLAVSAEGTWPSLDAEQARALADAFERHAAELRALLPLLDPPAAER